MTSITTGDLLGRPLNDLEKIYQPQMLYVKGTIPIPLTGPRVSIVGSRKASINGLANARKIVETLSKEHVVIVSGLAEGIDTCAHKTSIESKGKTIAVLGTPLNKTYPLQNFQLQQEIMTNHLAISQFKIGNPTTPKNFVLRNRTMALISDATVIVEAGEKSGTKHQGWEALRLGRSLFIWKAILDDTELIWPKKMLEYGAVELSDPNDIFDSLPSSQQMSILLQNE